MTIDTILSKKIVGSDLEGNFYDELDFLVTSSAFRRLQDKAQIFPLESGDFSRTRLTHSIECSSTAEMLGNKVCEILLKEKCKDMDFKAKGNHIKKYRDMIVVLKSAALIHDLGNPPFGHVGENIISKWFSDNLDSIYINKEDFNVVLPKHTPTDKNLIKISTLLSDNQKNDLYHFEGNAQLIRILKNLIKPNCYNGYTSALVSACRKYLADSTIVENNIVTKKNDIPIEHKKVGYFTSEKLYIDELEKTIKNKGKRSPIAFLLEATDDISYLTSDIEDSFKKNLISIVDIRTILKKSQNAGYTGLETMLEEINKKRNSEISFNLFRFELKKKLILDVSVAFSEQFENMFKGKLNDELLNISKSGFLVKQLRNLLKEKVYFSKEVCEQKTKVFTIMNTLLEKLVLGSLSCLKDDKEISDCEMDIYSKLFSKNYRAFCKNKLAETDSISDKIFTCLQLAIDEISGMTDLYAKHIYDIIVAK